MEPVPVRKPEPLPVAPPPIRLRETLRPSNRELDPGSVAWAGIMAPLLGALGYLVEHVSQLEGLLRTAGVPEGTISAVLFALGLLYAATTRSKRKASSERLTADS